MIFQSAVVKLWKIIKYGKKLEQTIFRVILCYLPKNPISSIRSFTNNYSQVLGKTVTNCQDGIPRSLSNSDASRRDAYCMTLVSYFFLDAKQAPKQSDDNAVATDADFVEELDIKIDHLSQ